MPLNCLHPNGEALSLVSFNGSSVGASWWPNGLAMDAHSPRRPFLVRTSLAPTTQLDTDHSINTDKTGRFPLGFQCVPALILFAGVWFLLESPRWLMEKDKHEEARAVLAKLRNGEDVAKIDLEFIEIRDVILADREIGKVTTMSILTKPSWRKRLLLGCGVQAFGPLSGINVIN